tara:strand:+ start:1150 stop:1410 length:261 start_codon:yes stop_codon:yes gene_type:complete
MAYCDVCGNFNWEHVDGDPEVVANMTDEGKRNFQPDLYYYWDYPLEEDYNWRDTFPDTDCMCEVCFDIADSEKKIKWQLPRCQTHL